jgi:hypothetical protein
MDSTQKPLVYSLKRDYKPHFTFLVVRPDGSDDGQVYMDYYTARDALVDQVGEAMGDYFMTPVEYALDVGQELGFRIITIVK